MFLKNVLKIKYECTL